MLWVTILCALNVGLDNFPAIRSWVTTFGVDQDPTKGFPKMKLTNFTDPQKPPKWVEILPREAIFDPKIMVKFQSQIHTEAKMGQKKCPLGLKTSFAPNFTIFIIFEVWRNFYASGHFFENLVLWVKNFQKFQIFKNLKKHHFSTFVVFCCFLGKVGQVAHICPILHPRNFQGPRGYPVKI